MKQTELVSAIEKLSAHITEAWNILNIPQKQEELAELQARMQQPGFWDDADLARTISQKASALEEEIRDWESIQSQTSDLLEIAQIDESDQTVSLREELEAQFEALQKKFKELEFYLLFTGKHDKNNAIIAIHAGTGGTDAQDWADILFRMYTRFCEKRDFRCEIIDQSPGTEAGIKSVIMEVTGPYAYGNLKAEQGVHRLVRISPFDAEGMRHTSFALVEVLPEVDDTAEIEIKDSDLRIDTYRASGKGGQNVNKIESAVRITHIPTGIVAACQSERSQHQNKERALKLLKAKLQAIAETEQEEEKKRLRGEYTEAVWGNQIRSYVMHPYQMVKDHRTNYEESDIQSVLDGNIDQFIIEYLKKKVDS